jgi:hypothetical protein
MEALIAFGSVTDPAGESAALRAEVEHLRGLVGPDDRAYAELAADVSAARAAVREAEAEAGRLRGTIAEMQVQLVRARQDQERYQGMLAARRAVLDRAASVKHRVLAIARRSS